MFKNSALWNTRYKDTSVHMPWREQEAGLPHNRNSYFSPAVNSTWKHRKEKTDCGEDPELRSSIGRTDTAPVTASDGNRKRDVRFKKTTLLSHIGDYRLPPSPSP